MATNRMPTYRAAARARRFVSQSDHAGPRGRGESAGFFHGAPDLAVEIGSAERPKAMQVRIQDYPDAGTPLLCDPI
jgi:Uma2 family endonuclease